MKASDFQNGKANIPQYRSHAWIEVYKDDIGWVPYEMTPSSNMETLSDTLDQSASQHQIDDVSDDTSDTPLQQETSSPTTDQSSLEKSTPSYAQYLLPLTVLTVTIVLLVMYRYLTRHWLNIKTRHMSYQQKVLIYYQVLWKLNGHHHLDEGCLKDIAYQAKYSLHEITTKQWQQFYDSYRQWLENYDQTLKWYQKFIFRYIKGYR